jgi:methionyl-tRNA formyltransferase
MAALSAECLARAVKLIESGRAAFTPQDESAVTYAPKLAKEEGRADWSRPAEQLARAARAFNPWPTLQARLPDRRALKILRARAEAACQSTAGGRPEPGVVLAAAGEDFVVAAGSGALRLLEVQAEGRRPMLAAEFLRGARLAPGARLG